jgi:hypothetical protein
LERGRGGTAPGLHGACGRRMRLSLLTALAMDLLGRVLAGE